MLTVLLLAIDTFFQQVTDLPERWTPRGEGWIPRARRYQPDIILAWQSNVDDKLPIAQPNEDLTAALLPYFYEQNGTQRSKSLNGSQVDFPVSCPTSRCEWPPYQSLGVCSACEDISSLLTFACLPMKMDWLRSSAGPTTESTYPNGTFQHMQLLEHERGS